MFWHFKYIRLTTNYDKHILSRTEHCFNTCHSYPLSQLLKSGLRSNLQIAVAIETIEFQSSMSWHQLITAFVNAHLFSACTHIPPM